MPTNDITHTNEKIILVNPADKKIGSIEKITAHEYGMLHRAFSVFIFKKCKSVMKCLLQKRSKKKYHAGGLWTNACCSHPHTGEEILECASKRLKHEMGIEVPLREAGSFHYIAQFKNGLTENEIDHVLVGFFDEDSVQFNSEEVSAFKWVNVETLRKDIIKSPKKYTPWLMPALEIAIDFEKKHQERNKIFSFKKLDVVKRILGKKLNNRAVNYPVSSFAPTNIALCKYWGKKNQELNIPANSSLSISLKSKGTTTEISSNHFSHDIVVYNKKPVPNDTFFYKRLITFLNLFRTQEYFYITITSNIPLSAGLASSACGFASIVLALNKLFRWRLNPKELSILARLGSGSASRSIFNGFVEWNSGTQENGMDSFSRIISAEWKGLCVGLFVVSKKTKYLSSTEAMERTLMTSPFYECWLEKATVDIANLKRAIKTHNFDLLGKTAESNSVAMHAAMLSSWPPINYSTPQTIEIIQKIWTIREKERVSIYFTQDAGPNLVLLFLEKDKDKVCFYFPKMEVMELYTQND